MIIVVVFAVLLIIAVLLLLYPAKEVKPPVLNTPCQECHHPLYQHGEYKGMICAHTRQVTDTKEIRDCNCALLRWDIVRSA